MLESNTCGLRDQQQQLVVELQLWNFHKIIEVVAAARAADQLMMMGFIDDWKPNLTYAS